MKKAVLLHFKRTGLRETAFLLYLVKSIVGLIICYNIYRILPQHQFQWSMVSVLLVLTPNDNDSNVLAFDRIKANVIGSAFGLAFFFIHKPDLLTIVAAVTATILFCTMIKLGNASRTALAALIIVMVFERENDSFVYALERVMCVLSGCSVALALTLAFSPISRRIRKIKTNSLGENHD